MEINFEYYMIVMIMFTDVNWRLASCFESD